MFDACADPKAIEGLTWAFCYLTSAKHVDFYCSFLTLLALLAITYLAGIASVSGAALAAILTPLGIFTLMQNGELPTEVSKYSFAVNGAMLILVAVIAPSGITGAISSFVRTRVRRRPRDRPNQPSPA